PRLLAPAPHFSRLLILRHDPAPPPLYTLSLHDALPISHHLIDICDPSEEWNVMSFCRLAAETIDAILSRGHLPMVVGGTGFYIRSEEHTSELQSRFDLVCRLLLEKTNTSTYQPADSCAS